MSTKFALLQLTDGAQFEGDSLSDLVDQIVLGHGEPMPETGDSAILRFELRHNHLVDVAHRAQSIVMAAITEEFGDFIGATDEDFLTAVYHDRGATTVALEQWQSDIPLFLMAAAYEPYTELPRPTGDSIVFLDAVNERTFIESLQATGFVELYQMEAAL
jgi:hypothetical protein